MNSHNVDRSLFDVCQSFIKARRNFHSKGHESKFMFNVTCHFTDIEGLRFTCVTNSPFDYLKYEPTLQHVFLDEATLQGFAWYVDLMFSEADKLDDWSYFKIMRKLAPEDYQHFTTIVKTGRYGNACAVDDYRVPISLIPVAEFQLIEDCSREYSVKSNNAPLERSCFRIKLNTFFRSVMTLLNCSEEDLIEILYDKQVLPSKDFQLISTQKELTIGMKRFRSCGLQERFELRFREYEQHFEVMKPKYAFPNSNLCQALQQLFALHPLYFGHQQSLLIETHFIEDGCLEHAVRNRKRNNTFGSNEHASLPKKLLGKTVASTQTEEGTVLAEAMCRWIPELYLPPGKDFLTINLDTELIPSVIVFCLADEQQTEVQENNNNNIQM